MYTAIISSTISSVHGLSVRLFVTSRCSIKTVKRRKAKNAGQEPMRSSFLRQRSCRNSNGSSATGAPNSAIGRMKFAISEKHLAISPKRTQTVQRRVKYTNSYMRSIESPLFDHLERPIITSNYTILANVNPLHFHVRYAVAHPSACRLSVCNARAPYSGGRNFRQYFYGVW